MTTKSNDMLLNTGKLFARSLQVLCALAGGITLLIIPVAVLARVGALPASLGLNDSPTIKFSLLSVVTILLMLALTLAALFTFFGKMRAIIMSVQDGDPFIPENARRLNAMAWLLLGVQVVAIPIGGLRLYLANHMDGAAPGGDHLDVSLYDLQGFVLALVIFILARVFSHGAAMRDDLEGTV